MPQVDPDLIELGWGKTQVKVKEEEKRPEKASDDLQKPAAKAVPRQPADEGYNHRKASMALLRLRRNENRMAALPEGLRELIATDDDKARKLLKEHGGNVEQMIQSSKHMIFKETAETDMETTTPLTEFQDGPLWGAVGPRCLLFFQCLLASLLARLHSKHWSFVHFPHASPER